MFLTNRFSMQCILWLKFLENVFFQSLIMKKVPREKDTEVNSPVFALQAKVMM